MIARTKCQEAITTHAALANAMPVRIASGGARYANAHLFNW